MSDALELLKGTLDLLVLRTVALEPMHGYGVAEWMRERTGGAAAGAGRGAVPGAAASGGAWPGGGGVGRVGEQSSGAVLSC
jgi:hypothetical protein